MTARESRTLRWGATAAGAILLYALVVDPYIARSAEVRDLVHEREARLVHLRALERMLPRYLDRLGEAKALWHRDVEPRLLSGQAAAVAASSLSESVRAIALQSFLEIERESVLPTRQESGLTAVPVQFSLRGDVYGLRDLLFALESTRSFLHLSELRIMGAGAGFDQLPMNIAPLQITATVEGYLASGLPTTSTPSTGESSLAGQPLPAAATERPSRSEQAPVTDEASIDSAATTSTSALEAVLPPEPLAAEIGDQPPGTQLHARQPGVRPQPLPPAMPLQAAPNR